MKKIVGVGMFIPTKGDDEYVRLDSHSSLSDYDIAIFRPSFRDTNYTTDYGHEAYEGKTLYGKKSSIEISENTAHWKAEIQTILANGKNVYIILCQKEDFYIYTGTKEFSGTGKSQRTTNHVTPFDNYRFLPDYANKVNNSKGKTVVPIHIIIKQYYEAFKERIDYECYIKSHNEGAIPLFTTKNKDKILGLIERKDKGSIIFLPDIFFGYDYEYDEDDEENNKDYKIGTIFLDHILKIDKIISGDVTKTPTPDWINHKNYELKEAERTKGKIKASEQKIIEIQKEIEELNDSLENQENLKGLLYETGKPLESAVIQGLKLLGYSAENYDDGKLELDQVINSPEGNRYIGECEGKDNRDIDITKFRQLQDSLNEDFEREVVTEKAFGILFGNPQRLISPSNRTLDFTDKCKRGAEREKIALIKTADLFKVAKYLLENDNEAFKKLCREEIHNQLGKVVKFPVIPEKSSSKATKK